MNVLLPETDRTILSQFLTRQAGFKLDLGVGEVSLLDPERTLLDAGGGIPQLWARAHDAHGYHQVPLPIPGPPGETRLSVRLEAAGVLVMSLDGVDWLTIAADADAPYTPVGQILLACGAETLARCRSLHGIKTLEILFDPKLRAFAWPADPAAVTHLALRGCRALTDLHALADHPGLTHLTLAGCATLVEATPLARLGELEALDLTGNDALETLALTSLPNLSRLRLFQCGALSGLELRTLPRLSTLEITCCRSLQHLALHQLPALTRLSLRWCRSLVSASPLATLTNLTELDLSGCAGLQTLAPFYKLIRLRRLSLADCRGISSLAPLSRLGALTELDLTGCHGLRTLQPLAALTGLTDLDLSGLGELNDLAPLTPLLQLRDLKLASCHALTSLAPLAGLAALERLDLSDCQSLTQLGPLAGLSALTRLDLSDCPAIVNLEPLSSLSGLRDLRLARCTALATLFPVSRLTRLRRLDLSGATAISNLAPLTALVELIDLDLSGCTGVSSLEPLAPLAKLLSLNLADGRSLSSLTPLAGLTALRELDLRRCLALTSIAPLARLTELTRLDLTGCSSLTDAAALAQLTRLTRLRLSGCHSLTQIPPLTDLTALRRLALDECTGITRLELARLPRLSGLNLRGCAALRALDLADLPALTQLGLSRCGALATLSLSGLTRLSRLDLAWHSTLERLVLARLPAVTDLNLAGCRSLTNLSLCELSALNRLTLADCGVLSGSPTDQWSGFPLLRRLDLSGCEILTSLEPLAQLPALSELALAGWTGLTEVAPLARIPGLRTLDLNGCSAVRDLDRLATLEQLRDLRHDIDPGGAAAVLAASARARGDQALILAHWPDWLAQLRRARDPALLAQRLTEVLAMGLRGGAHSWPERAADPALIDLLHAMLEGGGIAPAVWAGVIELALELGDPALRAPLECLGATLAPTADMDVLLRAWLAGLSRVPASARDWSIDLATRVIEPWRDTPWARELAPSIGLFFARQGHDEGVREWLEHATRADLGGWREQMQLALLDWELDRQSPEEVSARLSEMTNPTLRDRAWERFALRLAESAPRAAARALAAISDDTRQLALARRLLAIPAFTGHLEADAELLLALEQDPAGLLDLVNALVEQTPASPLIEELATQLTPGVRRLAGAAELIRDALARPPLIEALGQRRCEHFADHTLADMDRVSAIVQRGLLETLHAEGWLEADAIGALRDQLIGPASGAREQ